jgi:protein SCO1
MWTPWLRELLSKVNQAHLVPPRLKVSDRYSDVPLRTQFDREVRFRQAYLSDGRALVVNTMFTTCRGSCPGTSATIKELRAALSPVFGKRLTFLSLTLEPAVDTVAKLRDYARAYGADREQAELCDWHFLTGTGKDIDALRRSLGFFDLDPRVDSDVSQHASLLLCGNSTRDRWASMPAGLRKIELVRTIRRVAGFTFEQKYGIPG